MGKINEKNKKTTKKSIIKNRQELRKEKRVQKRQNKRFYFSKNKTKLITNVSESKGKFNCDDGTNIIGNTNYIESFNLNNDKNGKFKLSKGNENEKFKLKNVKSNSTGDRVFQDQLREKQKQNQLVKKMKKNRILQLNEANVKEDEVIKKLEKKLRIKKSANDNFIQKMFGDGLDYALELCSPLNDKIHPPNKELTSTQDQDSEYEFEDDLTIALGEDLNKTNLKHSLEKKRNILPQYNKKDEKQIRTGYFKDENSDSSDIDSEFDDIEFTDSDKNEVNCTKVTCMNDDEHQKNVLSTDENMYENDYDSNASLTDCSENIVNRNIEINPNYCKTSKIDEDIYGRARDMKTNCTESNTKYIPPQIRARLQIEQVKDPKRKEKLLKLKRQLKGLLNRLAEANVAKISKEIEDLYKSNSRFDMNNILTELLMETLISNILIKDRMALEHTLIIAILHVDVGHEISAQMLKELILKFDQLVKNIDDLDVENKELDNISLVISHMYTYKIFQHSLIFEILNLLIPKLCEKAVECILLIIKSIGFQLRKDDPLTLRNTIQSIQKRSNDIGNDIQNNSRYKFMLEILMAIKNNNIHKIPQYDPSLVEGFKKKFKHLLSSDGKYLTTLNISINDLLNADEKGKWWVVGSAWSGNTNFELLPKTSINDGSKKEDNIFTEQLLQIAQKQKMNTNDRRNIFCIIMSSQDYLDAFEKLLRLSVKDSKLIVTIIIHCCLLERNFNPYYAVLAEEFCRFDRKYLLAVQFAVWDKINDINSLNKQQVENLAKFILYLIRKGAQCISILKVVQFADLNKTTLRFVRIITLTILLGDKIELIQIFKRIAPSVTLNQFKNAIILFIRHFLLKGSEKSNLSEDKRELLNERINEVEKIIFNKNFI